MKFTTISKAAMFAAAVLLCSGGVAQAKVGNTPIVKLNTMGMTARNFNLISISPDNKYVCGYVRENPIKRSKKFVYTFYVLDIGPDNTVTKAHAYPVEGVPYIEQACVIPDSSGIIFTTLHGTKFIKLDFASGQMTTIMEHKAGQKGFKLYPDVIINSNGKLLAQGYYYGVNDFATPNIMVEIHPDKTGIEAFTLTSQINDVQDATRKFDEFFSEYWPREDIGFISVHEPDNCHMYRWNGKDKTNEMGVKEYDAGKALQGSWAADARHAYSIQRADGTYDLCIYDAETDQKVDISTAREIPYMYVFLSNDGKTVLFNDTKDDSRGLTTLYYARENEGWEVKPIKDAKKFNNGRERISLDGSKCAIFNTGGLTILDIE